MFRSPRRPGVRVCGAGLSGNRGRCRAIAITGKLRCRWHGGRSTGPRTPEGLARSVGAMVAGRMRWVQRMREAKRMGLVEKFPGGRKSKTSPPRKADKVIHRAGAIVASEGARLPAVPKSKARDWGKKTHAGKLSALTGKALDKTKEILELACDPDNLKLLSIQKDAALSIIAA